MFEESNIKIYRCVKCDIDRREAEADITVHTPINLDVGLFKHQLLFCYSFYDKCLVDMGMKNKTKCQWLVSSDKILRDT